MVRLFVAITDRDWFDSLAQQALDEVNFWQPSGRHTLRALYNNRNQVERLRAELKE